MTTAKFSCQMEAQGEVIITFLGGGVKKNQIEFIVGDKYLVA